MIHRFLIFFCLILLMGCDDGDIITIELDFDQDLERCDDFEDSYILYDTRAEPNESLTLLIQKNAANALLFSTATEVDTPTILTLNGSTNRFNYRTYNTDPNTAICDILGDSEVSILEDYEALTGTVSVTVTLVDDDNDGIPSVDEGRGELDEDGAYSSAEDFDLDGIPDYLDEDDDNDNVKTSDEIDQTNTDGDNNPLTNPLDTDADGTPDYLDEDDDADGVLTRLEDENMNMNPSDSFDKVVNTEGIEVFRYLYPLSANAFDDSGLIANSYTRTITSTFVVNDVNLGPITQTLINFGTYVSSSTINN